MIKLLRTILCIGVFSLGLLSTANANLEARAGGMVYDDVLDITWLADANYAQTSGYDNDGLMDFSAANTWAAGLSYGGYDDWRLPTALNQDGSGPCYGYDCTSSEMGYMFYNNMGASALNSILLGANTANLALFTNLQSFVYWSGTVHAPNPANNAWVFNTSFGYQTLGCNQCGEFYAWAVRGDVAAIPEPETYAMLLAGLGLLGGVAKWRRRCFGAS
ncbi:MAG: DUF1566 domain-containing protein [Nitrosomonas sp.]|nr:DUF1566 domain-containing protein [Nitrosomonas sp.]